MPVNLLINEARGSQAAPSLGAASEPAAPTEKLSVRHLSFRYGRVLAVDDVSFPVYSNKVTALIGPSGCGKSTLLRALNRMHDLYRDQHVEGEVLLDGENMLRPEIMAQHVRSRIGMVFQTPTPFPMSIYDNVAFGPRLYQTHSKRALDEFVEAMLRRAALWDEVKDMLKRDGRDLSGGQQQRLCIARALALGPEVLLLDEPCSALDPGSAAKIEELIHGLKTDCTVVIITHNLQQAARICDFAAFMYLGKLIEFGAADQIFGAPHQPQTRDFVRGHFG